MAVKITGASRMFPIIGDPIRFVESPTWLSQTFAERGHDAVCVPLQVPAGTLDGAMASLSAMPNVDGLLVTMPHKNDAWEHCASGSDTARMLQVVSVMRRNPNGTWHGDMLDGLAFVKAQRDHGAVIEGRRALLIGAGGAGSAIAVALMQAGVGELIIHDPDAGRVDRLLAVLEGVGSAVAETGRAAAGSSEVAGVDLVFNASPLGMSQGDPLPIDPEGLTADMFVGDVISGHGETPLIAAARRAGCGTATGQHMVLAVQQLMADFMLDGASQG